MNLPMKHPTTPGLELDPRLAVLSGEGAQMRIDHAEPGAGSPPVPLWRKVPSFPGAGRADYYRLPLLKEPVWIWSVPAYFYVGGVAGGSAILAAFLQGRAMKRLRSVCRKLAFAGSTLGPALLTWDLGRRLRFVNMLRVFRPTSPMSVGSWSLAGTGAVATLALLQGDRPAARPTSAALGAGGLVLSGYTGVLLAHTANPLWQGTRRSLPFLFAASALASTAAVLELFALNRTEQKVVHRLGTVGRIAEAAGMAMVEREISANPEAARTLREGRGGFLWQSARGLLLAGVVLNLMPARSQVKRRRAAVLTTAGAVCLRYALMESGKQAAREPQAAIQAKRR